MKTMKNFLSMAALALMGAMMPGCSNDDNFDNPQQIENKSNVVTLTTTVSLDGGDATRALSSTGTKTFAVGETMAVIYNNGTSTVKAVSHALEVSDITDGGKKATFTFDLETPNKSADVTYIYPAAMAKDDGTVNYNALNSQDGTLTTLSSNLDYCTNSGAWDGGNLPTLTLQNQLAILAVKLKNEAGTSDITSVTTKLTVSDGTNTYNVNRSAAEGPIYVAIRPTTSATIYIAATSGGNGYYKTLATTKTYEAGNGYPVSWMMTEKPDLLSGVFSVSGSKTVKFSKGNLRYASGAWSFFGFQYDYYTSYSADAWDKFCWSTSATTYGMNTSTSNSTYSGNFKDWGETMGTGWFTLNKDEWKYLFNSRSASNGRYAKAKVNDVWGVILFPDTYTHPDGVTAPTGVNAAGDTGWNGNNYSFADWTKMESAGCVFLPGAGYRQGSSPASLGIFGGYWSATPNGTDNAYGVYYYSGYLDPAWNYTRIHGLSVRLVRQVE